MLSSTEAPILARMLSLSVLSATMSKLLSSFFLPKKLERTRLTTATSMKRTATTLPPSNRAQVTRAQALKAHMAVRNQPLMTASTPEMR